MIAVTHTTRDYTISVLTRESDEHGHPCLVCNEEGAYCVTNVYLVDHDGYDNMLHTCAKPECLEYATEVMHTGWEAPLVELSIAPILVATK